MDNAYVYTLDPTSPFAIYLPTAEAYHTSAALLASPYRIQYVGVYMDDLICAAQGDSVQQQRVSDLTLHTLK